MRYGCIDVTTSDLRFKKNIETIENALNIVMNLNGVRYSWRKEEYPDKNFVDTVQLGFIAQEVEKVLPEVVGTDENGWKSVQYTQVVALLVEAIKTLSKSHDSMVLDLEMIEKKYDARFQEYESKILEQDAKLIELENKIASFLA